MEQLWWLLVGHAVADFVFQSTWMAQNKNRHRPLDPANVPPGQKPQVFWPYVLTAHALTHGGMVGLITGRWELGVAETLAHWIIDFGKCDNWYGIHTDQMLHGVCKVLWCLL